MLSVDAEKIYNHLKYKDCVISFCHDDYRKVTGGAQKYILDLQKMMEDRNISYVALFTVSNPNVHNIHPNHLIIEVVIDGETTCFLTAWQVGYCFGELISTNKINVLRIFLNTLFGMNIAMIDEIVSRIRERSDVELVHILHDYYSICRNVFLFYNDEEFCGPAPVASPRCVTCRHGEGREAHYDSINELFIKHKVAIVAPSENGKRIFLRSFPHFEQNVRVVSHQNMISSGNIPTGYSIEDRKIRVAYPGYSSKHKGWDAWVKLNGIPNKLDYEFFQFSEVDHTLPETIFVDTSFHHGSKRDTTTRLIEHEIDVVLLWSNWFGTYNYTYYESLAANCFVITYKDSGNIADQTKHFNNGLVLNSELELVELFNDPEKLKDLIVKYKNADVIYRVVVNTQLADELKDKRLFLDTEIQYSHIQLSNDYEQTIEYQIQIQFELQRKLLECEQNNYRLEFQSIEMEKRYNEGLLFSQQLETRYIELSNINNENVVNIDQLRSHYSELHTNYQITSKRLAQLELEGFLKTFLRAFYKLFPYRIRTKLKSIFIDHPE